MAAKATSKARSASRLNERLPDNCELLARAMADGQRAALAGGNHQVIFAIEQEAQRKGPRQALQRGAGGHLPAAVGARRQALRVEGHGGQVEDRRAHVHGDAAVIEHAQLDDLVDGLDPHHRLVGQAAFAHEAHEAARAVAALLDLAAVGVEDAHAEIGSC